MAYSDLGPGTNKLKRATWIFLVDLENINLLDLVALEEELGRLLNVKVDLVTEASLNKYLRPVIEQEIRYILNHENDSISDEK